MTLRPPVCGCVGSSSCLCKPRAVTEMNSFLPSTIAGGVPPGSWEEKSQGEELCALPQVWGFSEHNLE